MPWDTRPGRSANGGPEGPGAARLRVQKQCRKSSFAFYLAVRDLLPVWLLEDMRASEAFHWDERGRAAAYSPSEALLYALVHDHQAYAHYLAWSLESPPSVPAPLLLGSAVTFPGTLGPYPYPWLSRQLVHLGNLAAPPQRHATDQADSSVRSEIHFVKCQVQCSQKYFCPQILGQGPLSLTLAREVQGLQKGWQRQLIQGLREAAR